MWHALIIVRAITVLNNRTLSVPRYPVFSLIPNQTFLFSTSPHHSPTTMATEKRVSPEIKSEDKSEDNKPFLATKERAQLTTPTHLPLRCTAKGCNRVFQAATHRLTRKAFMRHLFRFQKAGSEVSEDSQDSDLTRKQIFDRAHHLAYKFEALSYSKKPSPPFNIY